MNIQESLGWLATTSPEASELFNEIVQTNVYQLSESIVSGRPILDIGANIGVFSILASTLGASNIIAVEPVSQTFSNLERNLLQAGVGSRVKSLKVAVMSKPGMVRIGLQEKSGHNSLYGQSKNYESVYAVTLSDLIRQLGGDNIFLKMDCEGAEYDILLGTPHEEMAKVSRIAIEIHSDVHPSYKGFDLIWNRLKEFGFSLVDRQPLFAWDVDSLGHKVNYRPLPLTGEIWNR